MIINSYQSLYESSIKYGIRTLLLAEEEKKKLNDEITKIESECEDIEKLIEDIDFQLKKQKEIHDKNREAQKLKHLKKLKKIEIKESL